MTATTPDRLTPPAGGPMARLARLLRCTEGQAYTVVIGLVVATVAALLGLPPTVRDRGGARIALSPPAGSDTATTGAAPSPAAEAAPPDAGEVPAAPDVALPSGSSVSTGNTSSAFTGDATTSTDSSATAVDDSPTASSAEPAPTPASAPVAATGFGAAALAAKVDDPGAPDGVVVDGDGRMYVATNNGLLRGGDGASKVLHYGRDGSPQGELAVTGQDTARMAGLTGLVLAPDGGLLALDSAPARVLRLDVGAATQETYAELADLPGDGAPQPRAAAITADGTLYVTDTGQGLIWRIAPGGGDAEAWYSFPDGEATAGPAGIAFDAAGDLLVVSSMSLPPATGQGVVQRIDVRDDGTAGDRTTVASTEPLSGPVGITTAPGGAIVVALTSADVVLLLGPDGAERARLTADQVAEQAGVPLDGPTGLAVRDGSVLVTNQSPRSNDESHWVVFDIPLS